MEKQGNPRSGRPGVEELPLFPPVRRVTCTLALGCELYGGRGPLSVVYRHPAGDQGTARDGVAELFLLWGP